MLLQDKGRLGSKGHVRLRKVDYRPPAQKETSRKYNSLLQCQVAPEGKIIGQCFRSCKEVKRYSTWPGNREADCWDFEWEAKQGKDKGGGQILMLLELF